MPQLTGMSTPQCGRAFGFIKLVKNADECHGKPAENFLCLCSAIRDPRYDKEGSGAGPGDQGSHCSLNFRACAGIHNADYFLNFDGIRRVFD